MYGADITPNEHKLALQFGVLDNFYDSGEVSGDGHLWSTAAITSDYNEKTWQIAYRGKERTYDFQGTVADEYPLDHNQPDIDDPGTGYLWDNVARHGLSYRDYGEYRERRVVQQNPQGGHAEAGNSFGAGSRMPAHRTSSGRCFAAQCRRSARRAESVSVDGAAVQGC